MSEFMLKATEKTSVSFVTKDGKIDEEKLVEVLDVIKSDAIKANKGNGAAGRRFRINTVAMNKAFLEMRKLTPVK